MVTLGLTRCCPWPLCDLPQGLIVRFAGDSVDRLYEFLRDVLKPLEPQIGAAPYWERGDA